MTGPTFSFSETEALIGHLEAGDRPAHDLNFRVLAWLQTQAGLDLAAIWHVAPVGVANELSGAIAIAKTIFPDMRWTIGTLSADPLLIGAGVMPVGAARMFAGEAANAANALLAAMLRAYAARAALDLKARAA